MSRRFVPPRGRFQNPKAQLGANIPEVSLTVTRAEHFVLKQMVETVYERRIEYIAALTDRDEERSRRMIEETYPEICDLRRKLEAAKW